MNTFSLRKICTFLSFALLAFFLQAQDGENFIPPVLKLTSGPGYHWFGYYDKQQMSSDGRHLLGMKVNFEGRSPVASDTIEIGMIDLQNENKWIAIGASSAWGWQQGCMLQWRPGSSSEIIWNDREDGSFVSRIYNLETGAIRTVPKAIYTVSPDGEFAMGAEFNRIQDMRPGYGYAGIPDPFADQKAPRGSGIYRIDLNSGQSETIFSIAELAEIPSGGSSLEDYWHYFNHLLIAPDSKRFTFLHRYRTAKPAEKKKGSGFITRMFTADVDGTDLFLLDPSGHTSHFIWRRSAGICAWTKPANLQAGFYVLEDQTNKIVPVGKDVMTKNGHNTYVPGTNYEWILNDTYPSKEDRKQELYLFHEPSGKKVVLGRFHSPEKYVGEWRCDLHPRTNADGTKVIFDSTHEGDGRQMYMIDISQIVDAK